MKKTTIFALATTVLAVAAVLLFTERGNGDAGSYRFVEIGRGDVESTVSATGALGAVSTVQVGTQVSGQVAEIRADFNDRVKKGQLIARIDATLQEQAVREAEASLARAQADLGQREFQYEQAVEMWEKRVITETEFRTAEYNLALSKSSLVSAEAGLERAQRNLAYTSIYAPVDGTVIERNVDVGQTVASSLSAPQLFLIAEDLSLMQILVSVDESDIGDICEGQEVRFTVQAYPNETFTGLVKQVRLQSKTQENVVSYTVVVEVANPEGALLPGMTATVDFILDRAVDVLTVPNAALRFRATDAMRAEWREQRQALAGDRGSAAGDGRAGDPTADAVGKPETDAPGAEPAEADARSGAMAAGGRGAMAGMLPGGAAGEPGAAFVQLWYVDAAGDLRMARVRTGLTDGQVTEVAGMDLEEGMFVIAAVTSGTAASSATNSSTANPFQSQQEQGGRRGPPGGV